MYALGANTPSYIDLRSRSIEKPINSSELLEIAYEKQSQWNERQKIKEKLGLNDEDNHHAFVLLKNVSRRLFMDWIHETHHGIRPSFVPTSKDLSMGKIVFNEVPCAAHEVASGELMKFIVLELSHISCNLENTIEQIPGKDVLWTTGRVKLPDGGLNTDLDSQYPNVVIEVAYSESMPQMREEVHNWILFTDHVQISIGIKIYKVNTKGQRKMIILYEDRQGWTQEIEFGIEKTPQPLRIPIAVLYRAIPEDLQGIEFLDIQLVCLRNEILREL